jgi:hypothetical protein
MEDNLRRSQFRTQGAPSNSSVLKEEFTLYLTLSKNTLYFSVSKVPVNSQDCHSCKKRIGQREEDGLICGRVGATSMSQLYEIYFVRCEADDS